MCDMEENDVLSRRLSKDQSEGFGQSHGERQTCQICQICQNRQNCRFISHSTQTSSQTWCTALCLVTLECD